MKKMVGVFMALIMLVGTLAYSEPIKVMAADDDYSRCQDFEGANVPSNWQTAYGGSVELSDNHYKHGANSLLWNFVSDSKLRVDNPLHLSEAGAKKRGGMKIWIYNENPINDKVTFKFGGESSLDIDNPHYKFDVNINFKGWRAIWVKFQQEGDNPNYSGNDNDPLEIMDIVAPSEAGSLYFDIVEFVNEMPKSRSADYQMPKVGVSDIETAMYWDMAYYYSGLTPSLPEETEITQEQINAFNNIEAKYEKWIFGENIDLTKEPLSIRNNALQQFITEGLQAYEKLNIVKHADGRITGEPLFSSRDPHLMKFGVDVSRAVLLPLVYDYKINGNDSSKEKFFDTLDYMNDQGWAYGSGLGTMDHETNKHNGYFHAIYLMKNELAATNRLERERETIFWQTIFGKTFEENIDQEEVTSDELRTKFMYNLLYVLIMEDTPEKVRYMKGLVNYYNIALAIAPGYSDTIKSDYSLYHHRGTYLSAYGVNGIHMASLIAYLLSDTTFALSEISTDNIKNSLLHARIYANQYNVPAGASGRLPDITGVVSKLVPAYAYMALAANPIDEEMATAFMKLWKPDSTYLKDGLFPLANTYSVHYLNTMGGLQLAVELSEKGYQAESTPQGTWVYPYSSLAINRQGEAMVAVKGYSQYVWDYESSNKFDPQTLTQLKENVYGKYQSYGSIQINGSGNPIGTIESGYNLDNGWDWNRWPGATTKHLPISELIFTGGHANHRRFSDQTFVGGSTLQNQYGVFGMKLHDIHDDTSFRANKSVFFLGDTIVCLGSDIENNDSLNPTETTLFQAYMNNSTMPFWYNSSNEITTDTYSEEVNTHDSAWLIDPYNNGYYIPDASGLFIQRGVQNSRDNRDSLDTSGNYTTAWINHGTNPNGEGYEYAIKLGATPQQMETFVSNPSYQVLQKDVDAHIVTDSSLNVTGYAIMNQNNVIDHGYLKNVSVPCMVMTKDLNEDEIVLSMSDPDLRLPKFDKHKDITSDAIRVPSTQNIATLTLRGEWQLKNPSDEARIITSNTDTTIELDCVDGKNIEVELVKGSGNGQTPTPVTLNPTEDTYVRDGNYGDQNYGTVALRVKGGSTNNNRETIMKFDMTNVSVDAKTAELKIYPTKVTGVIPVSIYAVTDDSWNESSISYNNKPDVTTKITTVNIDEPNKWYTFDITQFVNSELQGDKVMTLYFVDDTVSGNTLVFDSREDINGPQLTISY